MPQKRLTVSTQGVFSDGVRQPRPDPREVAQVLAAPEPLSLWVRDGAMIEALRAVSHGSNAPQSNPFKVASKTRTPKNSANLSLFESKIGASTGATEIVLEADELLWGQNEDSVSALVERLKTRLFPIAGGVGFFAGQTPFFLPLPEREGAFVTAKLTARNAALGLATPEVLTRLAAQHRGSSSPGESSPGEDSPAPNTLWDTPQSGAALEPVVLDAVRYFLHTGQEIDILERSAADGKRGEHWQSEPQIGKRIYNPEGASHRVELRENDETETSQKREELDLATIEQLTFAQDADFAFAMLYVASTLAPPAPLPPNLFTGGWIDLDDVMEKIGWYPSELKVADREAKRAQIWNYLCYGNRAVVVGQRSGTYRDSATGEEISTRIQSPIWRIMSIERPVQRALLGEVPRRVQLVISKEWEPMLVSSRLAQYLPLAEVVGKIPPQKVAGDWARAIALVLARLWRMKPQQFLAGEIRPTRRELLTHYKPKTKTVTELLESSNPKRAVNYWHDAVGILCDIGFLAREGEAEKSVEQMLAPHPPYRWQEEWLNASVDVRPGENLVVSLQQRAAALPAPKPAPLRKRGRPRKTG